MNLQCRKCGEQIEVPEEALSAKRPRVTCPGCSTRYRLQPRDTAPTDSEPEPDSATDPAPTTDEPAGGKASKEHSVDLSRPIFEPGRIVADRYRVIRFLAQGGMGEVYEVEDLELLQLVALKTISARMGDETGILDRFKREIALARTITHPNVSRIFDLGTHRGVGEEDAEDAQVNFLTMELLRGETLSELLRRRHRLSTSEALPLIEQMCAGLDAAHRARVVHRDLKSENVFLVGSSEADKLADCRVVLTDFGVARGTDAGDRFASQVTGLGIVGTPAYMAPEQVENKVITSQADLYSLGIVIYEMVTGCLPFDADSPLTTAVKRLREAPPPPHVHVPDLPAWWERAILRCLERRPDDRFPDAASVVRALEKPVRPALATRAPAAAKSDDGTAPSRHPTGRVQEPPHEPPREPHRPPPGQPPPRQTTTTEARRPKTAVQNGTLHGGIAMGAGPRSRAITSYNLLWLAAFVALAILAAFLLWSRSDEALDPSQVELRRSVAVMNFENVTGRDDVTWLSAVLQEMVARELSRADEMRVVSGPRGVRTDHRQSRSAIDLSTDLVVSGSFESLVPEGATGAFRLVVKLRETEPRGTGLGTTVSSFEQETHTDRLAVIVGEAGDALRDALDVRTPTDPPIPVPRDPRARQLYGQAALAMDDFRLEEARTLLEEAVETEPANVLAHAALSEVWEAMGFSWRAEAEARKGFDLASGLAEGDRLALEGRYRTLAEDWDAARDVYARLWQRFPDDLDYGIALADAQAGDGAVDDAFATVAQLRRLPEPLSSDPRIDLAEARVAARGNLPDRQIEAALRAEAAAERVGARLLGARARLLQSEAYRHLGKPQDALVPTRTARKIYLELGHQAGHALSAFHLAQAERELGDPKAAEERFEEALAVYQRIGDRGGSLATLTELTPLLEGRGRLAEAQALLEQTVRIQRELEDHRELAETRSRLVDLLIERDRLAEAAELLEEMLGEPQDVQRELGPAQVAAGVAQSARLSGLRGDLEPALELQREALRRLEQPDLRGEPGLARLRLVSQARLAGMLLDVGEMADAAGRLAAAEDLATEVKDSKLDVAEPRALLVFQQGRLAELRGDFDTATRLYEEALDLRSELKRRGPILAGRLALAGLDLDTGLPARAELLAREARADAEEDGRRAEAVRASAILIEALVDDRRPDEAAVVSQEAEAWADVENLAAKQELELARARLEAALLPDSASRPRVSEVLDRFDALASSAAEHGLRPLAMRVQLQQAAFGLERAPDRRDEILGRLRVLETEARAAGLLYFANRAKVLAEYGA